MTPIIITKEDIGKIVQLSVNISGLNINQFLTDAHEFDLAEMLPAPLLTIITTNYQLNIQPYNALAAYVAGNKVYVESNSERKYYTAIDSSTGSAPPSAHWADLEVMNFYFDYVRALISYCFYYRFCAFHGNHIAPQGIITISGEFETQISDKRRGELLGDARQKREVWLGKTNAYLSSVKYILDNVDYSPVDNCGIKKRRRNLIIALGASKNNNFGPHQNKYPH